MSKANDLEGRQDMGGKHGDRPAFQSSIEARRSKALSEMKKGRSNLQTKPWPNTLAGKTGGTIRLVIRNRPNDQARHLRQPPAGVG